MNDVPRMMTSFPAACDAMNCASSSDLRVVTFSRSYPGTIDSVLALCNTHDHTPAVLTIKLVLLVASSITAKLPTNQKPYELFSSQLLIEN